MQQQDERKLRIALKLVIKLKYTTCNRLDGLITLGQVPGALKQLPRLPFVNHKPSPLGSMRETIP